MKRFMVRCDIEGVSGVVSFDQAEPGKPEYAFGREMFMADLLALVEGLKAGGADEVVIYDEHYYGRNVDLARLPDCARAICGKPAYRPDWAGGLDESFDGLILLGFHSKAHTPGGLLAHTYELDIRDLLLNGVSVGEIGMEAAIAGDFRVPTLMVTADSAGAAEAQALLPGVVAVVVKEAITQSAAVCYPLSVTTAKIRSAAAGIVKNPRRVGPYNVGDEVTLEIQLNVGAYLDAVREAFSNEMTGDDTLVVRGRSATEVWAHYWERKLRCQARAAQETGNG